MLGSLIDLLRPRTLWPRVPKFSARVRRSRSCMLRRASSRDDARIELGVSTLDGGGGKFSSLQGLEKSQNVEIIAPHPRQDSPPLRNPRHRRRLDKIARVLLDRSSFGICSNLGLGARWERRKIFLPAKL